MKATVYTTEENRATGQKRWQWSANIWELACIASITCPCWRRYKTAEGARKAAVRTLRKIAGDSLEIETPTWQESL